MLHPAADAIPHTPRGLPVLKLSDRRKNRLDQEAVFLIL
jgi:hypothetical protein